jgi:hypothetical protein
MLELRRAGLGCDFSGTFSTVSARPVPRLPLVAIQELFGTSRSFLIVRRSEQLQAYSCLRARTQLLLAGQMRRKR